MIKKRGYLRLSAIAWRFRGWFIWIPLLFQWKYSFSQPYNCQLRWFIIRRRNQVRCLRNCLQRMNFSQHAVYRGDVNERLRGCGVVFVIFRVPSVPWQPSECSFHHSSFGQYLKALLIGGSPHDFQIDSEHVLVPSDQLFRVSFVRPNLFQGKFLRKAIREALLLFDPEFSANEPWSSGDCPVCRLRPFVFSLRIVTTPVNLLYRSHALAVNDCGREFRFSAGGRPTFSPKKIVQFYEGSLVAVPHESCVNRLMDLLPLTSGFFDV